MTDPANPGHAPDVDAAQSSPSREQLPHEVEELDTFAGRVSGPVEGDRSKGAIMVAGRVERPVLDDLAQIYEDHFAFVWRIVRRLGVAERALDDAVQDYF